MNWLARGDRRRQREGGGRCKGDEEWRFFKGCVLWDRDWGWGTGGFGSSGSFLRLF